LPENTVLTNDKLYNLIFKPGFTTATHLSNISGRGVGLDIVYKNIKELGGEIDLEFSENIGSIFKLRLPLTLAIMDCQLVKVGEETFIIPLVSITEITKINPSNTNVLDNKTVLYFFRNNYIPIIHLSEFLSIPNFTKNLDDEFLIVVEMADQTIGILVDEVLLQQQIVIKNLEENYHEITGISGVTILGDARVALIIDVKALIDITLNNVSVAETYHKSNEETNEIANINTLDDNDALESSDNLHILSFYLANQEYGVDITKIKEIRMWEKTTLLPKAPLYIKGLINLRGSIIPIVDLRERFRLQPTEYTHQTAVITLTIMEKIKKRTIGIIVDQVADTYTVDTNEIKPLPENNKSEFKKYVAGLVTVNNRMITILNTKSLLVTGKQEIIT
jgi:chemotaxis protein histidine kinase CheA